MHLSEILIHLGEDREKYFIAIAPPIIQTSNFAFPDTATFKKAFLDEKGSHLYTRGNNPTTEILRKKLAALEGTEDALVFGAGGAAMSSAVIANVGAGEHIICVRNPYSWTNHLLTKFLPRFNVQHTFVEGTDLQELRLAILPNTTLLILESPNSITFNIQDIRACSEIAKVHNVTTIIDNTYASPLFQQPAKMGIDIVMHTCSKYLNGHSDVVAGVLCGTEKMMRKIFESELMTLGNILSPDNASLVIRGLRTLELRMDRVHQSGLRVARYLENHRHVETVLHPLLPSFPQYELATRQMSGSGGLFSILLKTKNITDINRFVDSLKRFLLAVSWGGHESLVIPFSIFHEISDDPVYPVNLIRFYIGLEDPDFLIQDLNQALGELN